MSGTANWPFSLSPSLPPSQINKLKNRVSFLFINLLVYQYGWLDSYFTQSCKSLFWFILIFNPSQISSRLLCLKHVLFIFWTLSYFLVWQAVSSLSCIFPAPALESAISPGSLESFSWELYLENKMWVLSVYIATGVSLLLGPAKRAKK